MTLEDVTIELMEANEKLDILHKDNNAIMEYLELSQSTFKEGYLQLIDFFKGSTLKELEEKREEKVYQEKLLAAIEDIELKTPEEEKKDSLSLLGLAGIIAGLIGVSLGVIRGWFQAIRAFAKLLSPRAIQILAANALKGIANIFTGLRNAIGAQVNTIRTLIFNSLTRFANLFRIFGTGREGSVIAKTFANIGARLAQFSKLFTGIGEILRGIIRGPVRVVSSAFNTIRGFLRAFANTIGRVAGIVGRLFAPVVAIIAIWDSVKGAIEGYKKEGIIGGIKGAITGFFNSLIFGPLDMIKNAAAWVLGKFGFKNAEKILKEFSFTELFTTLVNGVFDFGKNAVEWFKNQFGFSEEGLPSISRLVLGLVTAPFNLAKLAISKIMSLFGFESFDEVIASSGVLTFISDLVMAPINFVKAGIGKITKFFSPENLKDKYDSVKEFADSIVAAPINFVKSGVNRITSFFSFENLKEKYDSVKEFANSIVSAPINLMRSGVDKITESFSFEKLKERFESFNIKELAGEMVDSVLGVVDNAKEYVKDIIKAPAEILSNVIPDMDVTKEFIKSSLRNVLPVGKSDAKWYDVGNLVAKAIPKSVYKFAGIDPKTGDIVADDDSAVAQIAPPDIVRNAEINQQMEQGRTEGDALRAAAANGPYGMPPIVSNNSTVNTMTTNNTAVFRPNPSPVRAPDAASGILWQGAAR